MSRFFDTSFLDKLGSEQNENCSVIISRNATRAFEFERGWEGIPFNFILNSIIFLILILLFALLRKKAWDKKTNELSRTKRGWLQFIYGDRESHIRPCLKARHNEHHNHDLQQSKILIPPLPAGRIVTRVIAPNEVSNGGDTHLQEPRRQSNGNYEALTNVEGVNATADASGRTRVERSMSLESMAKMGRRLLDVLSITDNDIQKQKGIDAVQYLTFQRYIIYFLVLLTAICLIIILPINLQGNLHGPNKPYARTTVSNLEASSDLLWAHALISIALLPIGILLMCHFSKTIKNVNELVAKRTLFIRRIPKAKTKKDVIVEFIRSKFPDIVVEGVQFVYGIRKLKTLHLEHVNVVNAIYYCQEYVDEYRERCEIRPYYMGHLGGLCCLCKCCKKTDGLLYYREQEQVLERDLEKAFRESISNPVGSVFITFKTERMAQNVYKFLKENQEQACSFLPCFTCCYRFWTWVISFFVKTDEDELKIGRWEVSYAPNPEDVNWDDISTNLGLIWLRRIFINIILFFIFFFLSTPPILINTLNYLNILSPISSSLAQLSPILTEYLSPLLLIIAALILPVIIAWTSTFLPYKTMSEQNHSIMWKVYLFLLLMVLILPSLGLTSAQALVMKFLTAEKAFRWQCLFPVDNGAFFINYVLQSALLGNAFELLRLPELVIYFWYTLVWTKSAAEYENARQQILFDFSFGVRYARFLLIFCMAVSYSLSCPLIAPCGLLYMGLKHLVDKYNIYYVYTPSKINDRIHSTAIMFFHIGVLMLQFQVFTFSFLRTGYSDVTGLSMISVIVALIVFSGHCFFHCFRNINHLTYNAANSRPTSRVDKSEFCACLYLPPVLYELNEHGVMLRDESGNVPQVITESPNRNYGTTSTRQPGHTSQAIFS